MMCLLVEVFEVNGVRIRVEAERVGDVVRFRFSSGFLGTEIVVPVGTVRRIAGFLNAVLRGGG